MIHPFHRKTITFNGLRKARSTLTDFAKSYLIFHSISELAFFDWLDVLVYVECMIYQLDEQNEELGLAESKPPLMTDKINFTQALRELPVLKTLVDVLKELDLYDHRIEAELRSGLEYWRIERHLANCQATEISIDLAKKALRSKSFDYRILNLLVYNLRKESPNLAHLRFLRVSELFVELNDDLFDYEDDVSKKSFNIYRYFVMVYGSKAPMEMVKYISEVERQYADVEKTLEPGLRNKYRLRCQSAMKEDSGWKWEIPTPILDEEEFRKGSIVM